MVDTVLGLNNNQLPFRSRRDGWVSSGGGGGDADCGLGVIYMAPVETCPTRAPVAQKNKRLACLISVDFCFQSPSFSRMVNGAAGTNELVSVWTSRDAQFTR